MAYHTYESLLKTGRAAKVLRRTDRRSGRTVFVLCLLTAGDEREHRAIHLAFAHRKQAQRAGHEVINLVRKLIIDGKINTDVQYNQIIMQFVRAASGERRAEQVPDEAIQEDTAKETAE